MGGCSEDEALLATWPLFEAEDATEIHPPMEVVQDDAASGGKYIVSRGGKGKGWVRFDIDVPDDGVYILWGNTFAKDRKSNAFRVGVNIDTQPTAIWDVPVGDWEWSKVKDRNGRLTFELAKGKNSLIFSSHEPGTQLDAIMLTTDPYASP
jgi:hypothetical protein